MVINQALIRNSFTSPQSQGLNNNNVKPNNVELKKTEYVYELDGIYGYRCKSSSY